MSAIVSETMSQTMSFSIHSKQPIHSLQGTPE
jgi:hypothetical protein